MPGKYALQVNGQSFSVEAEADASLLSVLREQLDLIGAKYGCGEGQCGACTVLVDGRTHRSCTTPISTVVGKQITTIEGLAQGDHLHPVQRAFLDEGAMQCAYCTSGMIMSAVFLLNNKPNPTDADILQFMQGNICRCGTYPRIMAAIRRASAATREWGS
jgi:aerobic-type carbon monoxide dehydrogenase small subunit (CoxS/CutS family)